MNRDAMFTRREALQGIAGVTAAALLPSVSAQVSKKAGVAPWPEDAKTPDRALAFNDDWRFHRGDFPGAETPHLNDSGWRTLDVPHDWSIEDLPPSDAGSGAIWVAGNTPTHTGPFDMYASDGQTATGWTVGGIGWYRKTFDHPTIVPGGKAEIRFEGVYMNSDVWLNGVKLGSHPYGYTEFAFDITPHLKEGRNNVAVRVDNTGRNSRWYSGSGIYRKVWLTIADELRIPVHGVFVTTPEATRDAAVVNLEVTVESGATASKQATVRARLIDATGAVVAEGHAPVTVASGGHAAVSCAIRLKSPRLWSPADPYLYRVQLAVEADHKVAAATNVQIGIRTVEIDAAHGLRINGESLKLRGGCVHHDNGPLGSVCIPRAEERRVEILKANGYNAIRTSHNPPSRDFLDACDRLGMLVIDEAFDSWVLPKNPEDYHLYFKEWSRRDLEGMILRDRNHPSVIMWSIGNEINERAEPQGIEIGKALTSYAHALDPTRKVTAAICAPWDHSRQTWQDMQPAFTYLDVGGYNYVFGEYEKDHAKFPERIMMGTESFPSQVVQNWRAIEKNSWVIGDFVWTAMDYIGETGIGHTSLADAEGAVVGGGGLIAPYPWFNSFCGDIDLIGTKKPQSYLRDVVWRRSSIEMAVQRPIPQRFTEHVSPWGFSDELRSWTWPGFEGAPLKVRVYTRAAQVKLLLNGKEVCAKDMKEEDALKAEFTVPYSPGELKAVAYEGGREIGSILFTTTGNAKKLKLAADRSRLKSSRDDLSYIMATVVDDHGRLVPDAIFPVSFKLSGVGEIAAVGNANPKDLASFRQPRRDTFHGTCVAIVRPSGHAGTITLNAESPGLESATLRLNVGS